MNNYNYFEKYNNIFKEIENTINELNNNSIENYLIEQTSIYINLFEELLSECDNNSQDKVLISFQNIIDELLKKTNKIKNSLETEYTVLKSKYYDLYNNLIILKEKNHNLYNLNDENLIIEENNQCQNLVDTINNDLNYINKYNEFIILNNIKKNS